MTKTSKILATALAAAGFALAQAAAADGGRGHGGGGSRASGGHAGQGGHASHAGSRWHGGTRGAAVHGTHGGRHWSGGGHWNGHRGHWGGYRGGYYRGWYGPSLAFAFGVPIFWGPSWGWYDYPRETVVYREVLPEAGYMPGYMESMRELTPEERRAAEANQPQRQEQQEQRPPEAKNPLGMSYCASAKAYYPAVRTCPEGWSFSSPTR